MQARMLTRIGYMNWEMRNNYKEWMFKYYVLGNLNIDDVRAPATGSGNVNYRMQPDPNINNGTGEDVYNFPSVCMHYAGVPTNVCRKYAIPGIPRFEPTNLVGIDETTSSFIDAIVKEKSSDCSKRTQLNFNVTNLWAYNLRDTRDNNAFADAPQVAVDRVGAWPKGIELAIRTRSLERAMNRPPVVVCGNPGEGTSSCQSVENLGANHYGNERPAKAYWSGFRNLGAEDGNRGEMKSSFTLTELSPEAVTFANANSLSTMLMGSKKTEPKFYLDLKLQLVNYATFFTALIARDDVLNAAGQVVKAEGACDVSKIAIPVPGFPMGFYKNPEVLTYYAVKGEANFQGLFNPFAGQGVVKLTAYAAAKPMGGRIGPALFTAGSGADETVVSTRTTANNRRSTPYLSGLDLSNVKRKGTNTIVNVGDFASGMPIPINKGSTQTERFWIADPSDQVGGWVSGPGIVFGIPNMVYDFAGGNTDPSSYTSAVQTNIVTPNVVSVSTDNYASGLYKREQLTMLRSNLEGVNNTEEITTSIYNVRAPTAYEAANYTIPVPYDLALQAVGGGGNFLDTFGFIVGPKNSDGASASRYQARIYAPLFSPSNQDAIFVTANDVAAEIKAFMMTQEEAMKKYRNSMNLVAKTIYEDDPVKYKDAADRISDFPFSLAPDNDGAKPTCKSIAGTFLHFYFGNNNTLGNSSAPGIPCPLSLEESITSYFNGTNLDLDPHTHVIEYSYREDHPRSDIIKWDKLLTGYMPGPMRGATENGLFSTPYSGEQETMRRTGYSAKLVTLKSLTSSGHYSSASGANAPIYWEGTISSFNPLGEDVRQTNFRNALNLSSLGVPTTVNH